MNENPVIPVEPATETNALSLLQAAVAKDASIDTLERLMALYERDQANVARQAYYEALAKFQAELPEVTKTREVEHKGKSMYKYASLADIIKQIKEPLQAHGFSYRFEQDHSDQIGVTCVLTHQLGHSERNTMLAPADTSGAKNAVQALGSTVTYLQRYTLMGALGIATGDSDTDANIPEEGITADQAKGLKSRLQATKSDVKKFCETLGIPDIDAMPASKFAQADRMLHQKETASNKAARK